MVFYFYRKLLLPFALGLFYAGTDLVVIEAQNLCQSTENLQLVALCSAMPGEEFHRPTELASFRKNSRRTNELPIRGLAPNKRRLGQCPRGATPE